MTEPKMLCPFYSGHFFLDPRVRSQCMCVSGCGGGGTLPKYPTILKGLVHEIISKIKKKTSRRVR
jgi:hypothetical protein